MIKQLQNKVNRDGHAMFEIYEKPLESNIANLEPVDGFNSSDDEFEILWNCDTFWYICWPWIHFIKHLWKQCEWIFLNNQVWYLVGIEFKS